MWSSSNARNLGGPLQRNQSTPQQNQPDDIFSTAPRLSSAQGSFRFGNQPSPAPTSQQAQPAEEFPPLNRNSNGDIGQERGANLMSALGFGSQSSASTPTIQGRSGNGLLNALSANSRAAAESRSPPGGQSPVSMPSSSLLLFHVPMPFPCPPSACFPIFLVTALLLTRS